MKICIFALLYIVCSLGSVQACCAGGWGTNSPLLKMLENDPDAQQLPFMHQRLRAAVFGHAGLPLSPIPACFADTDNGKRDTPRTVTGGCNVFSCNCAHCYGNENCKGTYDHPDHPNHNERFSVRWHRIGGSAKEVLQCLDGEGKPALEPYLRCPRPALLAAGAADSAEAAMAAAEAAACADRDLVMAEPSEAAEARLSYTFCEPGKLVGRAFAAHVRATLDANRDGSVSCAEWGMAKMTSTLEQLGGANHGPRSLPAPECPMTPAGVEALARYNAYLGELTSATTAAARAPADEASRGGVVAAPEGR